MDRAAGCLMQCTCSHCVGDVMVSYFSSKFQRYVDDHSMLKARGLKCWLRNVGKWHVWGNVRLWSNPGGEQRRWRERLSFNDDAIWDRIQLKADIHDTVPKRSGSMQTHFVQATPIWNDIDMLANSRRATGPHDLAWAAHGQQSGCNVRISEESWVEFIKPNQIAQKTFE